MPHPRINPAVKGKYIKIRNWIKLSAVVRATRLTIAGKPTLRLQIQGKPSLDYSGPLLNFCESQLRKEGVPS